MKSNLSDLPIETGDLTGLDIGPRLETRSSDGHSKRSLVSRLSTEHWKRGLREGGTPGNIWRLDLRSYRPRWYIQLGKQESRYAGGRRSRHKAQNRDLYLSRISVLVESVVSFIAGSSPRLRSINFPAPPSPLLDVTAVSDRYSPRDRAISIIKSGCYLRLMEQVALQRK